MHVCMHTHPAYIHYGMYMYMYHQQLHGHCLLQTFPTEAEAQIAQLTQEIEAGALLWVWATHSFGLEGNQKDVSIRFGSS